VPEIVEQTLPTKKKKYLPLSKTDEESRGAGIYDTESSIPSSVLRIPCGYPSTHSDDPEFQMKHFGSRKKGKEYFPGAGKSNAAHFAN
jgi:hypothetical protein